jgi:hypothetical protein
MLQIVCLPRHALLAAVIGMSARKEERPHPQCSMRPRKAGSAENVSRPKNPVGWGFDLY